MKIEKIVITDITPEEMPAVLEILQRKQSSLMEELMGGMGMGFGAMLPMMIEKMAKGETAKISKSPVTLEKDAVEEDGQITITYDRGGFGGGLSVSLPAAKCPPAAQLKQGAKILLVFKGTGKPFEDTILGIELPKREKKAPAAGEKDKPK